MNMFRGYSIRKYEKVAPAVRRIMRVQLSFAADQLKKTGRQPELAVHEFRKCMKRIRSLLKLVRDETGYYQYKNLNQSFRDMARQLSVLRDLAVFHTTLREMRRSPAPPLDPRLLQVLDRYFRLEYLEARKSLTSQDRLIQEVSGMLQQQAGVPDSMHLVSPGFGGMEAGLRRIYRRGRRARQYALEFPTTAHFHELRKRVKDLWHASLVLYHAWPEMMSPLSVELKKASDLLGYEHDLAVLQEYLSEHPVPGLDAAGHLQADHQLLAERKRWQVLILEITGLLYAEAPASFTRKIGRWWEIRQENTRH